MKIRLDIPLSLSEIAIATGVRLTSADGKISYVCTDSREAQKGDLFIALSGKGCNGNDYAEDARECGAYILAERCADVTVSDTREAILRLITLYKSKLTKLKHTVAITGSVGKTTAKELVSRILSTKYKVHSSYENYNNDLGLMHTVLSAGRDTEALVVEMGMNHAGEIGALSHAVCPDVALITNVGTAHIGNLGSRKAIAAAKLEIRDGMRDGVLIIPYGEPLLKVENGAKTLSVDCEGGDYSLYIGSSSKTEGKFSFRGGGLVLENERVALPDRHQLLSLGYAIAIAEILGIESERIRAAIKTLDASILRQRYLTVGGYRIYDDTYSSSAEAAIAVMDALTKRHPEGVSAVLGDMLELGEKSEELHRKVGRAAAECGIQRLYLFGEFAERIAEGALMGGMPEECIFTSRDVRDLRPTAEQIKGTYSGEVLIVKASHALHAERLYDLLKE